MGNHCPIIVTAEMIVISETEIEGHNLVKGAAVNCFFA